MAKQRADDSIRNDLEGRKPSWSDHIRPIRLELYWAIARVLFVRSLLRSSSTDRAIGVFRGVI